MGKRIIQRARGKGSLTYRVRKQAYKYRIGYPELGTEGTGKVIKLVNSPAHYAPLAKIQIQNKIFYNPACEGMYEGQEIFIEKIGEIKEKKVEGRIAEQGRKKAREGDILKLNDIPAGKQVYNIEINPGDGGKLIRTSGNSATITKQVKDGAFVLLPSKKEVVFKNECRATLGRISGEGRLEKPIIKAGKKHYMMKAKNKLWPRTSAVKMNIIDHPFGSGRGKRIKSKIAKRNAPPGAKVGLIRPRRTGRRKK